MNLLSSALPQVTDVTIRLRDMQPYWVSLPSVLCSDRVATGTGAEDKCWNGMSRARWGHKNTGREMNFKITYRSAKKLAWYLGKLQFLKHSTPLLRWPDISKSNFSQKNDSPFFIITNYCTGVSSHRHSFNNMEWESLSVLGWCILAVIATVTAHLSPVSCSSSQMYKVHAQDKWLCQDKHPTEAILAIYNKKVEWVPIGLWWAKMMFTEW